LQDRGSVLLVEGYIETVEAHLVTGVPQHARDIRDGFLVTRCRGKAIAPVGIGDALEGFEMARDTLDRHGVL
jgi:hypothetical protein